EVAQGGPDPYGRTALRTGQAHQAGDGLDDHIVGALAGPRPAVPEAGDGAVDEPGVARRQVVVAQPQSGHRPGPERLQPDVGPGAEVPGEGHRFRLLEVEGDPLLAPVDAGVVERLALDERPEPPGLVATWRLDLDHPCPEVGQDHARERAGEDAGEV